MIALLGIGLYRVKVIRQIRIMAISIHGLKDYIYPILSEIQETQIPERLTLISINTIDHEEQGFHLWSFTIKDPDTLTPEESLEISNQAFPFDPEASLEMPLIHIWSTLVMVTVPFTC